MLTRLLYILFSATCITLVCNGQEIDTGPGSQFVMMNNPAMSGSEGNGVVRLSYINLFPGKNYNLHSLYFAYDSYVPSMHGGIGIAITDDYMGGIINDVRGSLSYAYFLQAGKDLFIHAGLSASVYHRGFSFENAVLPDQIDPLGGAIYPSADILVNSGRSVFDVGAGFVFITGKVFGGFSINHLAEPDLSENRNSLEKLKRKLLLHLTGDIDLDKTRNLKIRPLGYLGVQENYFSAGAGSVFESNYLSVNAIMLGDNKKNLNLQTGFSILAGGISIYYNYRFNIASANKMMPFSLLHQTGLAISLNNVDKRKTIKTIKFPKL